MHLYGNNFILYNISANLIRGIEQLYGKAISEVQVNRIIEEWLMISLNVTIAFSRLLCFTFLPRKGNI